MLTIRKILSVLDNTPGQYSHRSEQASRGLCSNLLCLVLVFGGSHSLGAGTIVDISTPEGVFAIELFDEQTPGTVANFLNYVNSGRYDATVVHRSETNFVIQGGGFTFNPANTTFNRISLDASIANEPGISNVRGTIAMAKFANDPNSATSQWFINLSDENSFLDSSNGGFTVFGRVIDDGMAVVDRIAGLFRQRIVQDSPVFIDSFFPLRNFDGQNLTSENLVTVQMAVRQPANSFDVATNRLNTKVDLGDGSFIAVQFSLESDSPTVVVRADASSVVSLDATVPGISLFDAASGRLTVPELTVNGEVAYRNLVFQLSDAEQLLFTLQSFE